MPVQIDMEMPKNCSTCRFCQDDDHSPGYFCFLNDDCCEFSTDRPDWCPLVETEDRTWHVVAEGDLPEEKGFYQCTVLDNHKNEVFIADVYKEAAGFFYDNELYEVIAWRELPEPWEGVKE